MKDEILDIGLCIISFHSNFSKSILTYRVSVLLVVEIGLPGKHLQPFKSHVLPYLISDLYGYEITTTEAKLLIELAILIVLRQPKELVMIVYVLTIKAIPSSI